jgi:hypothetical protein
MCQLLTRANFTEIWIQTGKDTLPIHNVEERVFRIQMTCKFLGLPDHPDHQVVRKIYCFMTSL